MPAIKSISFIINPKAGVKHYVDFEKLIHQVFQGSEYSIEIFKTQAPNHATELAADAVKRNVPIIVAIGGDGTVNEVAKALVHANSTLAIVPSGSGNGFARHANIPLKAEEALQLINAGKILRADSFLMNNIFSLNVSGIGFEAHVAHLFAKAKGRGFMNYAKLSLREFFKYKPVQIKMEIENEIFERKIFSMSFANSSQYGNNARIAPFASIVDEQLDICLMKKFPIIGALGFGFHMMNGTAHHSKYLEIMKCKNVHVTCEHELPFHIDGEPTGFAKDFDVKIVPASLNVLVSLNTFK